MNSSEITREVRRSAGTAAETVGHYTLTALGDRIGLALEAESGEALAEIQKRWTRPEF